MPIGTGAWQAVLMTQPNEPGANDHHDHNDELTAGTPSDPAPATPQWPSQPGPVQSAADVGYPPAPAPAYGPFPKTSNNAIAALILSIVAWVICPIIPAIIALVFASKADKEIATSNGWVTGGGLVTASKIVAWINIGLYAALLAIGILVLILAAVGGALS